MTEETKEISIQDLQLALEVYEIQSEQKLQQLKKLFAQKGSLDLAKMFYEERSSIEIKFQNIISDLIQFLVKQQVATTEKLRKTFYRILQNPLLLLFKVSRFEIFDLRLNGFDIELQPIDAITQLAKSLYKNIDQYLEITSKTFVPYDGKQYKSLQSFLQQATINKIQDKIFIFYSYLRKGAAILKKKFQNKVKIVDIFNNIEQKLLSVVLKRQDTKTVKQLSVLNFEIYELQPSFQVLYFYIRIPFTEKYKQSFHELQLIGTKAKQTSNYNVFILLFVKHDKQILQKLKTEKVDPCYKSYIQNALTTILQMWGCRVCYYRQFCQLFTSLFKHHPNQVQALQLTLKHNPNLSKDDIVLLRTNFKLEIDKKHNQLLSLLKTMSLQEINQFLNNFYHRTTYNMDFKKLDREKIINLLTLMNGNSSINQLFVITQRAFKQWNHTIDFSHSHKFIQTQFSYPKISEQKIKQSLILLTNLCALQQKGFKQYQNLIKSGTIGKALLQFVKFLQREQKCKPILSWPQTHNFLLAAFNFLRKGLNPGLQTQNLATTFSTVLDKISSQNQRQQLESGLISAIEDNVECFRIENCLNCFKKYKNKDQQKILSLFMSGVNQNNEMVRQFGYLDYSIDQLNKNNIPEEHAKFISSKYRVNNGKLTFRDAGIFNLSDLQVMTIPSQIDKVIDNFYFTLDSNSKKFIQYLVENWDKKRVEKSDQYKFYTQLIQKLVQKYPIAVPLLASVRINDQGGSKRFTELLSSQVGQDDSYFQILQRIISCRSIRYRNGKDYVQEQIIPMAMKQIIKNINSTSADKVRAQKLLLLAKLMNRANLVDVKLQTIQKSIQKVRYLLIQCSSAEDAEKYGEAFKILMRCFFMKKQLQMKKQNLVQSYDNLIWNEVRNYVSNTSENKQTIKDGPITEYIVVTPFTITQQFNIQEYKIKKIAKKGVTKASQNQVPMSNITSKLQVVQNPQGYNNYSANITSQNRKKVLLTNSKYDLDIYLGKQNIANLLEKQNVQLILNQNSKQQKQQVKQKKAEDVTSFIQYYVKSLAMPSTNHKIILQNVVKLIESDNPYISFLWTNNKNLQNYFINLLSVFEFAALQKGKRSPLKDPEVQRIVQLVNQNQLTIMKRVLKIFADLGYSNIWAQSFDMFWNNFPIRRFLGFNTKTQQSFLSIILKNTLQRPELREDLTNFLGNIFKTRQGQNALMYKVSMDKNLMNIIMKSLSIPHLQKISLMFHSNFNNLRLYTDQLHEGLKALNIASKNRAYNEYIKISKSVQDQQFSGPLKLFKQNFRFFIRIEKQGYKFKKNEQTNLVLGRLSNLLRNVGQRQNVSSKVNQLLEQYIKQISQLQLAIANRVKSFYLVTKLRDLSYQNAVMIPIVHQVMHSIGKSQSQILQQINKLQIFSLMNKLYNDLVRYEDDWRNINKYSSKNKIDGYVLENQLTLCSTRRFSHSMSKIYQKCDLQFDQVLQRCIDALKAFIGTPIGNKWLQNIQVYPAFLIKSFVDHTKANNLTTQITQKLRQNTSNFEINVGQNQLVQDLLKGFRQATRQSFVSKGITVNYKNSKKTPIQMLKPLQQRLLSNQTFVTLKTTGNIIFNKYKSSEATLQQIQVLGYIISYGILNKLPLQINLHPSIVAALSFNIAQLDYLLDIDFKIWQQLRNILSIADSATLTLNFSYNFESLDNFKPVRTELIDKGSSKKVNNLNRDQYCDLICCYILYEYVRPQINRLLSTILSIVPKELISCTSTKQILNLFYNKQKSQKILDQYMKKIGVVLPETLIDEKGKRIQNLKDFQNVQWLQQLIIENQKLRDKYWKDQTNLFVVTNISGQGSIRVVNGKFLIEHFNSKQEMKKVLDKL